MSTIHQIYCTHCTHGNSALERRQGELADRTLGYSARAGSMEPNLLRRYYRQIERYTYYYLPRDTPGEEKLRLTAATAPRRLIYLPASSGLQMVGQVCYRQTDSQGRPGSYFAHVLFGDETDRQTPWSALDGLKLWSASGWVREDSPDIPFLLRSLGSPDEVLDAAPPAVDDDVLVSFLTAPAGGTFHDPGGVIPQRWRLHEPSRRRALLVEALGGLLEVGGRQRGSLLLVVEPEMAALLFYGMLRLLPPGRVRDAVSFSTFEPNADRLCTTLAATWFYDPHNAAARPDASRSRALMIDTVNDGHAQPSRAEAPYARCLVDGLTEKGWPWVDATIRNVRNSGAQTADDLQQLAALDRMIPALLSGAGPLPPDDWRRLPMKVGYLRRALAQELSTLPAPHETLQPLIGRPAHLSILELLAGGEELSGTRPTVEFLLRNLPENQIAPFVQLADVSPDYKLAVLSGYVNARKHLPPDCEGLWEDADRGSRARGRAAAPLLVSLCARLDVPALVAFYQNSAPHADTLVKCLVEASGGPGVTVTALTQIVPTVDEETWFALLQKHGVDFFKQYPQDEPSLGETLQRMLRALPEDLTCFSRRLDVILAGEHLLPEDFDHQAAAAWGRCRRALLDLGRLQEQKSGVFRSRPVRQLEAAARRMAESVAVALSPERFEDDRRGAGKQESLRRIGQSLLGGQQLLPSGVWQFEALWQKVGWFFEMKKWPAARLHKMCAKGKPVRSGPVRSKSPWVMIGCIAAAVALVAGVASLAFRGGPEHEQASREDPPAKTERAAFAERKTSVVSPVGKSPNQDEDVRAKTDRAEAARREEQEAALRCEQAERAEQARRVEQAALEAARIEAERRARLLREAGERAEAEAQAELEKEPQWRDDARQFARRHRGVLLEELELSGGVAAIPPGMIEVSSGEPRLFLGPGKLVFDSATCEFGGGFGPPNAADRQEIPQLAAEHGLQSVAVEVRRDINGFSLCVVPVASTTVVSEDLERAAKIARLETVFQKAGYQLRQWDRWEKVDTPAAEAQRKEIRATVIQLLGFKLPQISPRPNPNDPRYQNNVEAFAIAELNYRASLQSYQAAYDQVMSVAKDALQAVNREIDRLQDEAKEERNRIRREREAAKEEFKNRGRRITAVVYRSVEPMDIPGESADPLRSSERPADAPPPSDFPLIEGTFHLQPKTAGFPPNATYAARLDLQLIGPSGKPLPGWFEKVYVTACWIWEQTAALDTTRKDVADVATEKTHDILAATSAIRVQFRFQLRGKDLLKLDHQEVARSREETMTVERGKQYILRFELGEKQLEELWTLGGLDSQGP